MMIRKDMSLERAASQKCSIVSSWVSICYCIA